MIPIWFAGNRGDDTFSDHVIECAFNLFLLIYGYLTLDMLHWGYKRVSPDGVGTKHITNGV